MSFCLLLWESSSCPQSIAKEFDTFSISINIGVLFCLFHPLLDSLERGMRKEKCLNVAKFRSIFDNIRYIMTNHRPCFFFFFFSFLEFFHSPRAHSTEQLNQPATWIFSKKRRPFFSSPIVIVFSCSQARQRTAEQKIRKNIIHVKMFVNVQIQSIILLSSDEFQFTFGLFQSH